MSSKSSQPLHEDPHPGQQTVSTGNASNPAPHDESLTPGEGSQLLSERAEKYLREVANIEDVPDAQDQQEMDETLSEESRDM